MARKEALELLLDVRLIELVMCKPETKLHEEIIMDVKELKKKLLKHETQ